MPNLNEQLTALANLSPAQLRSEWRRVHHAAPPLRLTTDLLLRGLAYRLQERLHGGLPTATARDLDRVAAQLASGAGSSARDEVRLKPGTRLVRSWQGRTYTVLVGDDGYVMGDHQFTSLSQVAEAITGARWSGPRFFGLKSRRSDRNGVGDAVVAKPVATPPPRHAGLLVAAAPVSASAHA